MLYTYRHPDTGDTQRFDSMDASYNTFILGPFYFLARGMKKEAVKWCLLALVTFGASWVVYPLFTSRILHAHYRRLGYETQPMEVEPQQDGNNAVR